MDMVFKTNDRNWQRKSKRVRQATAIAMVESLETISNALYTRAQNNLKGPHYPPPEYAGPKTGEMPVPRVTGTLARSLKMKKMTKWLWKVYSDGKIAAHNVFVHDGTKKTRPRRFIGDVVLVNRNAWLKYIQSKMKRAVLKAQTG